MNTTHEISPVRQRPFIAGFWLIIALPICAAILIPVFEILKPDEPLEAPITLVIFFIIHFGTGYLWARSLGRRLGLPDNRMMNLSGGLGFSLGVVGIELIIAKSTLIIHINRWLALFKNAGNLEFGALFAPWTGLVAGISGLALGLSKRKWKLGFRMFGIGFISGFLIYLAIMFTMQLFGFTVGSGRPVMLPTTFLSMWSTALVGSALFGRALEKSKPN
jgi:hypothetical protein